MKLFKAIRRWLFGLSARELLEDFQRQFPGRCPVCSFARYLEQHGHEALLPEPHRCPEARP